MTTVNVLFLHGCGEDAAGDRKAVDVKRAQRLARQGYVQLLDKVPESAVVKPTENASQPRPQSRAPKPERRG